MFLEVSTYVNPLFINKVWVKNTIGDKTRRLTSFQDSS